MANQPAPQFARINYPAADDHPSVHCSVCGTAVIAEPAEEFREDAVCKHLTFIYLNEIGDYGYEATEFNRRREAFEDELMAAIEAHGADEVDEEPYLDDFPGFLNALGYGDTCLRFNSTSAARRPVGFTGQGKRHILIAINSPEFDSWAQQQKRS